jgi:hypothetical protein
MASNTPPIAPTSAEKGGEDYSINAGVVFRFELQIHGLATKKSEQKVSVCMRLASHIHSKRSPGNGIPGCLSAKDLARRHRIQQLSALCGHK